MAASIDGSMGWDVTWEVCYVPRYLELGNTVTKFDGIVRFPFNSRDFQANNLDHKNSKDKTALHCHMAAEKCQLLPAE